MMLGPILLLLPMMCMHFADGHHSGDHRSSTHQPSYQYPIREAMVGGIVGQGWMTIRQDSPEEKLSDGTKDLYVESF